MNPHLCSFVEHVYNKHFLPEPSRRVMKEMGSMLYEQLRKSNKEFRKFFQGMCEVMQTRNSQLMRKPVIESNEVPATNMFILNLKVPKGTDSVLPIETHRRNESIIISNLIQSSCGCVS